jgi:hypothetical protein
MPKDQVLELLSRFYDTTPEEAREAIESGELTGREGVLLERFLLGMHGINSAVGSVASARKRNNTITVMPTTSQVEDKALELSREGIIKYFLDPVGLDFEVDIKYHLNPELEELYNTKVHRNEDFGTSTRLFRGNIDIRKYKEKISRDFICFVDNGDYFSGDKTYRQTGATSKSGFFMVLDRAYRRGRYLDNGFVDMTPEDREEYQRVVAGHETYHMIGFLLDIDKNPHEARHIPDAKDCLGYSKFVMPPTICEGCKDDVIALWHGIEKATDKKVLI